MILASNHSHIFSVYSGTKWDIFIYSKKKTKHNGSSIRIKWWTQLYQFPNPKKPDIKNQTKREKLVFYDFGGGGGGIVSMILLMHTYSLRPLNTFISFILYYYLLPYFFVLDIFDHCLSLSNSTTIHLFCVYDTNDFIFARFYYVALVGVFFFFFLAE